MYKIKQSTLQIELVERGELMVSVSRVEIHEASETLKALMQDQKTMEAKERLQALYLLKSGTASSVGHAAHICLKVEPRLQSVMRLRS